MPYCNDLEYLEDNFQVRSSDTHPASVFATRRTSCSDVGEGGQHCFLLVLQLIETLVKARRTETSDDALILRPDQRKPEAVLRELRAKARGLRAKLDQRMEATRAQGGQPSALTQTHTH